MEDLPYDLEPPHTEAPLQSGCGAHTPTCSSGPVKPATSVFFCCRLEKSYVCPDTGSVTAQLVTLPTATVSGHVYADFQRNTVWHPSCTWTCQDLTTAQDDSGERQ